jgi:hypothetical protein
MKLDIQQLITSGINNLFETKNNLPFFMHQYNFDLFAKAKNESETLTFDEFLKEQSESQGRYSFGIKEVTGWQFQKDTDTLVSVKDNRIDYSLVPLFIKEKETNKIYRVGQNHLLTPENNVYQLKD